MDNNKNLIAAAVGGGIATAFFAFATVDSSPSFFTAWVGAVIFIILGSVISAIAQWFLFRITDADTAYFWKLLLLIVLVIVPLFLIFVIN